MSCTKDREVQQPQTCGFVFDKYYQNPPADTTLANRTYWIRMASDTILLPPPAPLPTNWVVQVPKAIYDTILSPGHNAIYFCY